MENGGWRIEDGEWRMEDRGWRMELLAAGLVLVTAFFGYYERKDLVQESLACLDDGWPQRLTGTKVPSLLLAGRAFSDA